LRTAALVSFLMLCISCAGVGGYAVELVGVEHECAGRLWGAPMILNVAGRALRAVVGLWLCFLRAHDQPFGPARCVGWR
jgi:hypothetical protein